MSKLILMRGLPASGKTTKAREIMKESGNTVRLNRDDLRAMMHLKWSPHNERTTVQVEKDMAFDLLLEGHSVIIDDTNLGVSHEDMWGEIADKTKSDMYSVDLRGVDYKTCIERNEHREDKVPPHVIEQFALQYKMVDMPEKGWIVCDLDGTLCDIKHRLEHVHKEPKDWPSFFAGIPQDTVRKDVEDMLYAESDIEDLSDVIFVSARPETYREETEKWLRTNCAGINFLTLIMRGADDKRPDTVVKESIYNKFFKKSTVRKVFDDRPRVIEMWREKGLEVVDVGEGIDF